MPVLNQLCLLAAAAFIAHASDLEDTIRGLPAGATIIETRAVPPSARAKRMLVLWMLNPEKHDRSDGVPYTCRERSQGSYYTGPARVSLVDTASGSVIDTLLLTGTTLTVSGDIGRITEKDSFDIPTGPSATPTV